MSAVTLRFDVVAFYGELFFFKLVFCNAIRFAWNLSKPGWNQYFAHLLPDKVLA